MASCKKLTLSYPMFVWMTTCLLASVRLQDREKEDSKIATSSHPYDLPHSHTCTATSSGYYTLPSIATSGTKEKTYTALWATFLRMEVGITMMAFQVLASNIVWTVKSMKSKGGGGLKTCIRLLAVVRHESNTAQSSNLKI